jgi:hypothetical protein
MITTGIYFNYRYTFCISIDRTKVSFISSIPIKLIPEFSVIIGAGRKQYPVLIQHVRCEGASGHCLKAFTRRWNMFKVLLRWIFVGLIIGAKEPLGKREGDPARRSSLGSETRLLLSKLFLTLRYPFHGEIVKG